MAKAERRPLWLWKLLFWLYLAALLLFVVVKFDGSVQSIMERIQSYRAIRQAEPGYSLNLTPFATIRLQLGYWPSTWAVSNLAGNILAFFPFGFLLPLAHRHFRRMWAVLLTALLMTCSIEAFQYATLLGSCDVDDVILNLTGVLLGYLAFLPFKSRVRP